MAAWSLWLPGGTSPSGLTPSATHSRAPAAARCQLMAYSFKLRDTVTGNAAETIEINTAAPGFILGRQHLPSRALPNVANSVSREQAILYTNAEDGSLMIESRGMYPTGVKKPSGTWRWLAKGTTAILTPGDLIGANQREVNAKGEEACTWEVVSTVQPLAQPSIITPPPSQQQLPPSKWFWAAGRADERTWHEYDPESAERIEAAFATGASRADLNGERHVDFSRMRQVQNADASRWRHVRREPEPSAAAAAAASAITHNRAGDAAAAAPASKRPRVHDVIEGLSPLGSQEVLGGSSSAATTGAVLDPGANAGAGTSNGSIGVSHARDQGITSTTGNFAPATFTSGEAVSAAETSSSTLPLGFALCRLESAWTSAGLVPHSANHRTVSLQELLSPAALAGCTELHLINYMIDLDFVVNMCPAIRRVPRVIVLHGDGRPPRAQCVQADRGRFLCLQPPCEKYGTHHSKMILIVQPDKLTCSVTTANFIFSDWLNKTNGVWTGSFPRATLAASNASAHGGASGGPAPSSRGASAPGGDFGTDLIEYYEGVKALGLHPPPQWEPRGGNAEWHRLDLAFLHRYDYSGSIARLIGSLPGRHTANALSKWGHMRCRALLDADTDANAAKWARAPLVLQFSSLSSPGTNPAWMGELVRSFCGPSPAPSAIHVVYPTQAQVRDSLEGWIAGSSIPCSVENAERLRQRLHELPERPVEGGAASHRLPRGTLCGWDGGDTACGGAAGRALAVPHIKTYCRFDPHDRSVGWFVLTSHNLSQAAWGKLEKNGTQLYLKSYELGVLLLPSLLPRPTPPGGPVSGSADATSSDANATSAAATQATPRLPGYYAPRVGDAPPPAGSWGLPVPYALPPHSYAPSDVIWSTTEGDGRWLPRTQAAERADRHGRYPAESGGGFYGSQATGRVLAEETRRKASSEAKKRMRTKGQGQD